eukprot:scaffold99423_cov66-Phaeocystis_antarctica.AAC.1
MRLENFGHHVGCVVLVKSRAELLLNPREGDRTKAHIVMLAPVGGGGGLSEAADPNIQIKSESDKARGKRKAKAEPVAECEDTDDGECMEVDLTEASGAARTVTPDTQDDEDEDCQITGRSGSLALSDVRPRRLEPPLPSPRRVPSTLTGPRCCSPVSARSRELRREEVDERPLQGQHRVLRQLLLLRLRLPRERVQGVGITLSGHTHGVDVARHAGGGQGCCQGGRGSGECDRGRGRRRVRVPAAVVV